MKIITENEYRYILQNYKTMSVKEIAINLKRSYQTVYNIIKRGEQKIVSKNEKFDEPEPPKIKIERPPAVYTNPQWNEMFYDPKNYTL